MKGIGFGVKYLLIGLSLVGILAGGLVSVGQAQQRQGSATLGSQDAVRLLASAVTCFDAILLDNDGMVSGTIKNEAFTLELEDGGGSRTFKRAEIDTLQLATPTNGLLKDRIILTSGNIFQGTLQAQSFQIQLATDEEITLPKAQVQGAILTTTPGATCGGGGGFSPLDPGKMRGRLVRLINNPLTPGLINSLSKYDWVLLSNAGIMSGSVCDDQFSLEVDGQQELLAKDEISAILFGKRAGTNIVVLKTGEWLVGTLAGSELCLGSVYENGQSSLARETLRGVIFRTILSGGGG